MNKLRHTSNELTEALEYNLMNFMVSFTVYNGPVQEVTQPCNN